MGSKNGPLEDPRVKLHNKHRIRLESIGWIGFTCFVTTLLCTGLLRSVSNEQLVTANVNLWFSPTH